MPGARSPLQSNSDFMNKIEPNNLIQISSFTSLGMKVNVDKDYFEIAVTNLNYL